ncbi:MAG: SGNH/GDSL hydrolase family protein [Anaerolineales bacterium]
MPPSFRFLALGNSYTIGTGVPASERWPRQLSASIREAGFNLEDPLIIAKNGWTSGDVLHALGKRRLQGPFHLASLQIGVNDQYDGLSIEAYETNLQKILDIIYPLTAGDPARIIALSIPDWSATPFAEGQDRARIAAEIQSFNEINRRLTHALGAHYLDITPLSREAGENRTLLAEDGLHPSGDMYQRWVEALLPVALDILNKL